MPNGGADLAARVAEHPVFRGVTPPAVTGLSLRTWRRREVLFRQDDSPPGLILIFTGRIRIIRTSAEGRRQVLHEESEGGSLGEVPLFAGGGMAGTAVAMEPSSGVVLPPELLQRAIVETPALALHLLSRLARRTRSLAERLEQITTRRVQARLAGYLLERARRASSTRFGIGMTQTELADELGSVREVIVRELRDLCRRGALVTRGGGRYELADRRLLRSLALGMEPKSQRA
jgi:CRP-like cAMP-binding protein